MKPGANNERVFRMSFASVYPQYVTKAEPRLGAGMRAAGRRSDTIIHWLTGYTEKGLQQVLDKKVDFETFFAKAPKLNPNMGMITGVIPLRRDRYCGYRVEDPAVQRDEDPLMQQMRYLDKLIDELAKGKAMDKILRK